MSFDEHDKNGQTADGSSDENTSIGDNGFADDNGEETGFIATEEKKPAISRSTVVMFGVLALGALGVWTMYQRIGGPALAIAGPESVKAKQTINTFLEGGGASIRSMQTMLHNTEKVVQQFLTYPSMTQVPLSDLRTNPFRLRPAHPSTMPADEMTERRKREEERVAMLKSVQSLQLQTIMFSDTRKACMINDKMYHEGQQLDAFTVEKITANSVIVKGGVCRFELRMKP